MQLSTAALVGNTQEKQMQEEQANKVDINLEHKRYRHMSEKYLIAMNPKLKGQQLKKCQYCSMAKSKKGQIKHKAVEETKSTEVGENVASDLKEMFAVGTGGCRWLASAIDTYSRYAMMTALKNKSDFSKHYPNIVSWYTTQTGKPVKKWTTDNGGEFLNLQTDAINKTAGIQHQVTPPHQSKKNPFAERWNRTVEEGAASMLLSALMTSSWWVEASQYTTYLYNRTPHKGLGMRTPYEVFYNKPHHHIPAKVFGCLAYTHNYLRTKKQMNRTRRAIFLGIDSS